MPFFGIKGQERAINYLQQTMEQQRLAHAMLFSGPEGVGKKTAALALAQALNCSNPNNGDACGSCRSCKKTANLIHPDVQLITNDNQSIKIDQIREQVQHQVMLKPLEGKYKVYIIDPAEAMTIEAANSLLKVLEEPPTAVMLILLSAQPFLLLETIRSRCQEVRFNPINIGILAGWLSSQIGIEADQAKTLAMLSGGRPAEALRLAEPETQALRKTIIQVIQENVKGEWARLAETLGELRSELPEALGLMLTWFRDLLLVIKGGPESLLINHDYRDVLQQMAKQENPGSLEYKCHLILTAINQLKRNINVQLLLEVLLMRLSREN